uniref:Uncharacterized protein n=1 Tax=Colobus angolensis palliatus TaxID=336983 RepID=A0A2K5IMK9_COLAP
MGLRGQTAVNQSHTENRRGVLIPNGESLLKWSPNVELSFPQQSEGSNVFSGTKTGTLFLTSYRYLLQTSLRELFRQLHMVAGKDKLLLN